MAVLHSTSLGKSLALCKDNIASLELYEDVLRHGYAAEATCETVELGETSEPGETNEPGEMSQRRGTGEIMLYYVLNSETSEICETSVHF